MPTQPPEMLYPMFALAGWTFVVLARVAIVRIAAGRRGEIRNRDFKYGESATVPDAVRLPNRNYMNLLELPVLFYTVCLLVFAAGLQTPTTLALAWGYVALRVGHSLVHLGYNNVMHRLAVFAAGNFVLLALWFVAAAGLVSRGGA